MKYHFEKIRTWVVFLSLIYLLSWLIKGIFFSIYMVPSGSMVPTISGGDYVVAVKFPWRIRTPEFYPLTGIPLPFVSIQGPVSMKRGDVLVFSSPIPTKVHPSRRMTFVKRIAGFPGDTLFLRNGLLLDTQRSLDMDSEAKKIVVPGKGMTVSLTGDRIEKWKTTIRRDGAVVWVDPDGDIFINNTKVDTYTFRKNFYFMTGDDSMSSSDSRHWGVVPEDHMIGKAMLVLWSPQTGQHLKRIF